jgi:hypothetical protein
MLLKKLHLKSGMSFAAVNAPPGFVRTLGKLPAGVTQEKTLRQALDLVLLFARNKKELKSQWAKALASLKPDGALWVAYPKKSSGIDSDLAAMNSDWEVDKNSEWQPVSSIAIDGTWSGVRFRHQPGLDHVRSQRQEELVRDADGTVCIDRKNRIVTPPGDLQPLLNKKPKARSAFDGLSFTNQREYVGWILEAKKPETRAARVTKTVEMLSEGRKNPSDK